MVKVTDTLKRVMKFKNVEINNGRLNDGDDVVEQILENLPDGVTYFDVQITTAIPSDEE